MVQPSCRIAVRALSALGAIVLTAAAAGISPAAAQVCPPGYYYASDGNCYAGAPPAYPPAYDAAPPVAQPPVVFDGLGLGIGLGVGLGILGAEIGHDNDRGHGRRPAPPHRAPERHDERGHR